MFIFRWIKSLIILILVVAGTIYIANYSIKGKTVQQYVTEAYKSGLISEGFKDIKTWIAELFRVGNNMAKDHLTEKDKEALETVIKNELKDNIMKLKEESVKTEKK